MPVGVPLEVLLTVAVRLMLPFRFTELPLSWSAVELALRALVRAL